MSRVASELLRFFVGSSSSQAGNAAPSQASSSAHAGAVTKPIPVAEPHRAAAEPRPERQQSKVRGKVQVGNDWGWWGGPLFATCAEAGLSPATHCRALPGATGWSSGSSSQTMGRPTGERRGQQHANRWHPAGCQQGLHSARAGLLGWLWQRVTHPMGPGTAPRYSIKEVIGKGSYGVVCSAIDNYTGEKVAIKKINNVFEHVSDATRILREIKLLRLLKHPGRCSVGCTHPGCAGHVLAAAAAAAAAKARSCPQQAHQHQHSTCAGRSSRWRRHPACAC